MDNVQIKQYLDNLEQINQSQTKGNEQYKKACETYKNLTPGNNVKKHHSLNSYFNKYWDELSQGKLLAFKKNEVWLISSNKIFWEIPNDSDFLYFEVPINKVVSFLSLHVLKNLLTPMAAIIALSIISVTFISLFSWKAVTGGGGQVTPVIDPDENPLPDPSTEIKWSEISEEPLEGEGTKEEPFQITTGRELAGVAQWINSGATTNGGVDYTKAYYELENSVNLTGKAWEPIGTKTNKFSGTFTTKDNKPLKIVGLTNNGLEPNIIKSGLGVAGYGLFGYTYDANISNINLEDVQITFDVDHTKTSPPDTFEETGAIVGWAYNGLTIKNCKASGFILTGNNDCIGGLVGKISNNSADANADKGGYIFEDCESSVHVYADRSKQSKDYVRAGGLVGQINYCTYTIKTHALFKNCISNAIVEGHGVTTNTSGGYGGPTVGAFVGGKHGPHDTFVIFDNCTNNAKIINSQYNKNTSGVATSDEIIDIQSDSFVSCNMSDGGGDIYLLNCNNHGEMIPASAPTKDYTYSKRGAATPYIYIKNNNSIYKSKCEYNFAGWTEQTAPTAISYSVTDGVITLSVTA